MILWVLLFLLVIGISFVLAFRSMKDFQEIPQRINVDYGLFLVRQIKNFNANLLDSIRQEVSVQGGVLSLERLLKGRQAALTVFGPKNILAQFQSELDLLELEDYTTEFEGNDISVWEVGVKDKELFGNLPQLEAEEQFFLQVIPGKNQVQIRAAVFSKDPIRKKMLSSVQSLNTWGLNKIPKPFLNEQMIEFYKARSLSKETAGPILDTEGIMRLLTV